MGVAGRIAAAGIARGGMRLKRTQIVLASGNPGKLREIADLLRDAQIEVLPQSDFKVPAAAESGCTFVENALIKARNAALHSGLPAIADDSGIAVDVLGGAPGVHSATYAGATASDADNLNKLLADLIDVPDAARGARFISVMVYLHHAEDPVPLIALGQWEGRLLHAPVGTGGFGYDPIFLVPTHGCSSAQLTAAAKNGLSHRGQALRSLLAQWYQRYAAP